MEDAGQLTFQAQMDPKLMKALLRRVLFPILAVGGAVMLAMAALLYWAGDPGDAALSTAAGGVIAPLLLLFTVPPQVVKRDAHKIGRPVAYRIDAAGVHSTSGFSTKTLEWSAIKAVHRARGQILLSHGRLSSGKRWMSSIPTADLTPAEQDRLLAVLRSRGAALTNAPAS
ncbi:YcxB family protein [Actinoplanes regularis]|nr:YcxB family protein [Actinoplanes regularis]